MNIGDLLAKQDEHFVNLRDLLEQIAKTGNGCTVNDAAVYLHRLLQQQGSPVWHTHSRIEGVKPVLGGPRGSHRGWELLRHTAENGWELSDDIPF